MSVDNSFKKNILKYISLGVVLFLGSIMLLVFGLYPKHSFYSLPYYGNDTIFTPEVNEPIDLEQMYRVGDFEFTNHLNQPYNLDSLDGEVWLAVFYATNSHAIKDITSQLLGINYRYRNETGINLVCFSLDTEHDSPEVLKKYIDQMIPYNVNDIKWQFLTGDQEKINSYIHEVFMIEDVEDTSVIWLVDNKGHLRGRYHGNDSSDMKAAAEDIALLRKEIDREIDELKNSK